MGKDAYVFYCSKCKTDHAGECAKQETKQDSKLTFDELMAQMYNHAGVPYIPAFVPFMQKPSLPPAYVPPVAPPTAQSWFNGKVTAIDKAAGYVTIKLDDISNAQQLSLNQTVEIDTETDDDDQDP